MISGLPLWTKRVWSAGIEGGDVRLGQFLDVVHPRFKYSFLAVLTHNKGQSTNNNSSDPFLRTASRSSEALRASNVRFNAFPSKTLTGRYLSNRLHAGHVYSGPGCSLR